MPRRITGRPATRPPVDELSVDAGPDWMTSPLRACSPERAKDQTIWTSESSYDLKTAALICQARCPFVEECGRYAVDRNEQHYVWGGVVRSGSKAREMQDSELGGRKGPTVCPNCSAELPADYPWDHTRIDRGVAGDLRLFRVMGLEERREVIRAGRAQGLSDHAIAERLRRRTNDIHQIMGESSGTERDLRVKELWAEGLSDSAIALRLNLPNPSAVGKARARLGLPALFGPGGHRLQPAGASA